MLHNYKQNKNDCSCLTVMCVWQQYHLKRPFYCHQNKFQIASKWYYIALGHKKTVKYKVLGSLEERGIKLAYVLLGHYPCCYTLAAKLCSKTVLLFFFFFFRKNGKFCRVEKTSAPPRATELCTCKRLIKVDLFSVTLHEGANEVAFALIKWRHVQISFSRWPSSGR